MITREQLAESRGATVLGAGGGKIGTVEDVYVDRDTEQPEWVAVSTGMFGTRTSLVPLAEATMQGSDLVVPYAKDHVKGAPTADPDAELTQQEEAELYSYYGLPYSERSSDSGLPEGGSQEAAPAGYDVSGPTTDDAMTRSEEELRVGKTTEERGRVRLRKHVVTEQVQQTVPVQREEVRVEREPITDANVDRAMDGPAISDEEHEVVLHEERPVVEKRAVPKERVRVSKDTVTDDVQVSDEVRKERIDEEGDVTR
ncbi:MAG TPA: PRC and DUF2382 domain-containing protein [Actinomycetota bacterium]|nr:PRC and DUF2382 domain-containing protein [Actinomycetota bacterium]